MLVLTRKIGESIVINGNITISVVSVGPGRVKIGVAAPSDVSIDREEIHAKKAEEAGCVDIGVMPESPGCVGSDTTTSHPATSQTQPMPQPQTLHNRIKAIRSAARTGKPLVDKPR